MSTFQSSATPPCAAFPERIGRLSLALAAMQLYLLPQLDFNIRELKQTDGGGGGAEKRRSTSKFLFRRIQGPSEFIRPLTFFIPY